MLRELGATQKENVSGKEELTGPEKAAPSGPGWAWRQEEPAKVRSSNDIPARWMQGFSCAPPDFRRVYRLQPGISSG